MTSHLLKTLREVLMDAVHVSFDFFKVLIPISIAMKILAELDWIRYLALPLEPVMQLTGLPADLGIAWATGIMVNFYSALIVFIGLLPGLPPLTTEQVTTLAVMMLIAHSIPAEGRIAAQCGVSFIGQAVIRLVVAVIGGVIVHTSCQAFGWLDTPAPPKNCLRLSKKADLQKEKYYAVKGLRSLQEVRIKTAPCRRPDIFLLHTEKTHP